MEVGIPFDRETCSFEPDPAFTTYFRPGITKTPKDVNHEIDVQVVKDLIQTGGLEALQKKLAENFPDFPPLKEVGHEQG